MKNSLLSVMRYSNLFMRMTASVSIITFLMLLLLPTVVAAQTISKDLQKKSSEIAPGIEAELKEKKLSDVIMQRHYDMVANYRKELAVMLENLGEVELAKDDELERKVEKAKKHLDSKKHKRSHQPFDSENMPFKSVEPDKKNKPKNSKGEFHAAGLYDSPLGPCK